jgi:heme oxygenase
MLETDSSPHLPQHTGRKVLASLRQGTRTAHNELESHPSLIRLIQTADVATYRIFVQSLQSLCLSVAESASQYFETDDLLYLDYAGWMEALQLDTLDLNISRLESLVRPLPPLSGPASFWARLYVLEGSALGGRVLARELTRQASLPVRFLDRAAGDAPQRWPYVLRRLTQFGEESPDQQWELVDAAQGLFQWLGRALDAAPLSPAGRIS